MIAFYERQPWPIVKAFQLQRISGLVQHALKYSPWWRSHLRNLATNGELSFTALPLTNRNRYRASVEASGGALPLPADHGKAQESVTSGSSGIVVKFHTSDFAGMMNVSHYRYDVSRHGYDPGRVLARFNIKMPEHPGEHVVSSPIPILGQIGVLERRVHQFTLEQHAQWLSQIKPAYIAGLPTLLSGIIDAYERGEAEPPRVENLFTLGETVTPAFRQQARSVLGARISDRYSCEEIGPIAFQCPVSDGHYHIASTNALVEILDDDGTRCPPGTVGRVFVTGLHNYASPVLRYEVGDLAAWQPRCVCGHAHPVLENLLGRKRFLIRLPSGQRKYVQITLRHLLPVVPLREYRIVQVSEGVIHAECVMDRAMTPDERKGLMETLQREISPDLIYEIKEVGHIAWGPTYKRQDVVSLV
jgi:phenylacetate-CoA ligase